MYQIKILAIIFQAVVSTVTAPPYGNDNIKKAAGNEDFPSPSNCVSTMSDDT